MLIDRIWIIILTSDAHSVSMEEDSATCVYRCSQSHCLYASRLLIQIEDENLITALPDMNVLFKM